MPGDVPAGSFAAFLRGINVGGRRVKMDELRAMFEALGFGGARTFIASGNVIFDAPSDDVAALEAGIEEGLRRALGYDVETFLRSAEEVRAIDRRDLFGDVERTPDDKIHVLFLRERPPAGAAERIGELLPDRDALAIEGREVYWLRRGRLTNAPIATFQRLQAAAGKPGTMRTLNTVKRIAVQFFCVLLLTLTASCGSSGDAMGPPDDGPTRSFYMGFTDFPRELSAQGLVDAYHVIETSGDLVALHFDDGVPWQEALDGTPYPAGWVAELDGKASLIPSGHERYLAVTPLSADRSGLAANRGPNGSEPLAPPWDQKAFDNPDVVTAFGNHVLRMVDRFDPDELAIAIEANMLFASDPSRWDAFVDLVTAVRARVRQAHPSLPIFVTLQAEYVHRDEAGQTAALQSLLPQSDVVAVSTYPYFDRTPVSAVPSDYLDDLANLAPQKPFAISESGWPAETVTDPWPETIVSSASEQTAWVERLLADGERLRATFVVWFFTQDLDQAWDQGLKDSPSAAEVRLFRDTGLLDGTGAARPAMAAWRNVFTHAREP